jgi:hypothetical protein
MNVVLVTFGKHLFICFTLDGASNVQGKQVICHCVPKAYVLEHFITEQHRESAATLLEKLFDMQAAVAVLYTISSSWLQSF